MPGQSNYIGLGTVFRSCASLHFCLLLACHTVSHISLHCVLLSFLGSRPVIGCAPSCCVGHVLPLLNFFFPLIICVSCLIQTRETAPAFSVIQPGAVCRLCSPGRQHTDTRMKHDTQRCHRPYGRRSMPPSVGAQLSSLPMMGLIDQQRQWP